MTVGKVVKDEVLWKNFDLGAELDIAGSFVYNALRCFHEMRTLNHNEEIFEFLYNLSVGLERLLKIVVILLEHEQVLDQERFQEALKSHSHPDLLSRVKKKTKLNLSTPHKELLNMLGKFYESIRYSRLSPLGEWNPQKETEEMKAFFEKNLPSQFFISHNPVAPTSNEPEYKRFIGNIVGKISSQLYDIIQKRSRELNIYSYELRSDSKAAKIFLSNELTFLSEDILLKELLVYFMNANPKSGLLRLLKTIEPLDFDDACAAEYLQCFMSGQARIDVMDELEVLYDELDNPKMRLDQMNLISEPGIGFSDDDETED